MGFAASSPRRTTTSSRRGHPDGTKIAYQEDGAIFTIELGGTNVEKLTEQATNDSSPTWNPQPAADGQ